MRNDCKMESFRFLPRKVMVAAAWKSLQRALSKFLFFLSAFIVPTNVVISRKSKVTSRPWEVVHCGYWNRIPPLLGSVTLAKLLSLFMPLL